MLGAKPSMFVVMALRVPEYPRGDIVVSLTTVRADILVWSGSFAALLLSHTYFAVRLSTEYDIPFYWCIRSSVPSNIRSVMYFMIIGYSSPFGLSFEIWNRNIVDEKKPSGYTRH